MIQFEPSAVAFIDLLGFTAMVNAAEGGGAALAELQQIVDLLDSAVPNLNSSVDPRVPVRAIPRHTYISDSIIISAPLVARSADGHEYDGLRSVVMRSIQISHLLLKGQHLVRGGITIGNVWHTDKNIIGTAYISAYELEKATSKPRIAMSPEALAHWHQSENEISKMLGGYVPNYMCKTYEGIPMVNGLHEGYINKRETHGALDDAYKAYDATIKKRIDELGGSAKEKWEWFQQYFNDEAKRIVGWIAEDRQGH